MGDGELKHHIQQQFTEAGIFWCAKENIQTKAKIIFHFVDKQYRRTNSRA